MTTETRTHTIEQPTVRQPVWHIYDGPRPHPAGARAVCGHIKRSVGSSPAPSERDVCVVCIELAGWTIG